MIRLFFLVEQLTDELQDENNKCLQCGNCCLHDNEIKITKIEYDLLKDKPRVTSGGNACVYLNHDNRCSVYECRPIECRLYNVIDKNIYTQCNAREPKRNKDFYLSIRELVYSVLKGQEIKPLKEWLNEEKSNCICSSCR